MADALMCVGPVWQVAREWQVLAQRAVSRGASARCGQVLSQCEAKLMRLMDTVEGEQASVDADLVRAPVHACGG